MTTTTAAADDLADEGVAQGQHHALRALAYGAALVYAAFIVVNLATRDPYPGVELALDAAAGLACFAIASHVRRFRPTFTVASNERWALVLGAIIVVNISSAAIVSGRMGALAFLPFIAVAAGSVCLRWSSFAVLIATFMGGVVGAGSVIASDPELLEAIRIQVAATMVALSIVSSRRAFSKHLVRLRRDERVRLRELAAAEEDLQRQLALKEAAEARREELEAERASLQAQVAQSQRLEALGTLAGGVAHDMNNVLAAIGMTADTLLHDERDARRCDDLSELLDAVQQGASLTRNLLAFARRSEQRHERFAVGTVMAKTGDLLVRTLPKGVQLEIAHAVEDDVIVGDAGQFGHALINLCINASDAQEGRGRITIESRVVELRDDPVLSNGSYLEVVVRDDGPGMDRETVARAFEPFFSSKGGEHSGLGLSMVFGTMRQHQGDARIQSAPGEGTQVHLLLPQPSAASAEVGPRGEAGARDLVGTRVLVVDDEPLVRSAMGRLLRRLGAESTLVRGGREALERYREEAFDLVLLDVAMPEMSGPETFAALQEEHPDVRVVFVSGYSQGADIDALLHRGACGFLHKPCTREQLLHALHEAL